MRRSLVLAATCLLLATSAGAQTEVDPASLMTTPVLLYAGTRQLSQGTGFFFANTKADGTPDTVFLVTNYHVVTGISPLSTETRRGDRIRFVVHEDRQDLTRVRAIEVPLYDERGDPVWISSAAYPAADIVLVPVPAKAYAGVSLLVFTEAHTQGDIRIRTTSGATLLGYPFGFYDQKHFLPIWKTGHVASEPTVDFEGRPVFLVDVSAFPGMSGSPVLAVANGIYETESGSMRSGRIWKLLGVFSAMPVVRERRPVAGDMSASGGDSTQLVETPLQLGYVWKAGLIADLARSYTGRTR
jgi:hypothetical protein